jgi:hypothetical protein
MTRRTPGRTAGTRQPPDYQESLLSPQPTRRPAGQSRPDRYPSRLITAKARPPGRAQRAHLVLELRHRRGQRQPAEDDQTPDVRPRQLPAAPQAGPARPVRGPLRSRNKGQIQFQMPLTPAAYLAVARSQYSPADARAKLASIVASAVSSSSAARGSPALTRQFPLHLARCAAPSARYGSSSPSGPWSSARLLKHWPFQRRRDASVSGLRGRFGDGVMRISEC